MSGLLDTATKMGAMVKVFPPWKLTNAFFCFPEASVSARPWVRSLNKEGAPKGDEENEEGG